MREHHSASVQRATRRRRGSGGGGDGGVVGGHNACRFSIQAKMAEQDEGAGEALRQAQHCHRSQRASVLGEVRPLLRGRAQGGQAQGRVLRHEPRGGRGHGRREHHLRCRHPRLHPQWGVRGRQAPQRSLARKEQTNRVCTTFNLSQS